MKPIFILGQASLSPQGSYITDPLPEHLVQYDTLALTALEPDYKGVIGPVEIRRMNHSMKMGVWCAKKALEQAGLERPDAIITGSGLGCLQDTVNFLKVMLDSEESASAPTFFISSTHNSVGGQLALRLQCTGYNFTYCHKSLSFYSALLDAVLHLEEDPNRRILVGALDEHVEYKFHHYDLRGWWRKKAVKNTGLFSGKFQGTISGEGCHYFVLGSKGKPQSVALMDMRAAEKPSRAEIENWLDTFLKDLDPKETLVLMGFSGDSESDVGYYEAWQATCTNFPVGAFRHLCGTYPTSDGFALALAIQMLKDGKIPSYVLMPTCSISACRRLKHVVIYSHLRGLGHVAYKLSYL